MAKVAKKLGKKAPKKAKGHSRAPARPGNPWPLKAERVRQIAALMAADEWSAATGPGLAERWGLDAATVRKDSAEASRLVRDHFLPPVEETRGLLARRLDEAYLVAKLQLDAKGMVAAVLAHDKISGASGPQKVAITNAAGQDVPDFINRMPVEVMLHFAAQGRVPSEAEAQAKAEELEEAKRGKPGT